uniref:NADH dehydrogenase subunit 4L n=1 Tax=Odoiporus longicollis TaxID=354431 RepID=UPI0020010C33|nr:NADH dehydrogenase subunit 4L [Odoiporus longicollis]UOL50374.1 NADH dehydrogenase subunit 4L [Odoiporus longicollis]
MFIYELLTFSFLSGLFVFSMKRKHMLLMLLSLEYVIVSLFLILFVYLSMMEDYYFSLVYLTMSVCESALGLSILVMMIRNCGNDFVLTFSSLW